MLAGGATIGSYRVLAQIGEGGMGAVYLAEHILLGRRAAIKVLISSLSANEEIVQRFFNEARAVTRIADPGIVQIFDFGYHTDGSAFIVMELLEGEPMDRRLARVGRIPPGDCLRFLRLICTSLAAAHGKGIVHRDLKPENLFIVADPAVAGGERVKILDFGIAKLSGEDPGALKTRTGMVMGTPVYMSPEQCRGAGDIDHRSDIYSIGCVMFTMLTGRPPFEGNASGELIAAHLREPPPRVSSRVPELPAILEPILERCLRKSPLERFASMLELVQAIGVAEQTLEPWRAPQQHPAMAPGLVATPAPRAHALPATATTLGGATGQAGAAMQVRRRGWIAGIILGAVAIAVAAGLLAQRGGDEASGPVVPAAAPSSPRSTEAHAPRDVPHAPASPAPAPAAGSAATDASALRDAGVSDAAVVVEPLDAAPPPRPARPPGGKPPQPSTRGDHASPKTPPPPVRIDRAD